MPKAKELLQTLPHTFFIDGISASANAMIVWLILNIKQKILQM
jgi:hypothetical protein